MKEALAKIVTRQDFYTGLVTVLVGALGLLDIVYGNWREGPAVGPHAFPQLAYITLIGAGLAIWIDVLRGKSDSRPDDLRAVLSTGVALVAAGIAMFWLAGVLGLGVSVAVTLIGASFLLTREPLKHWPTTIVVPIVATAVIYALFILLIGVPLQRGLIF